MEEIRGTKDRTKSKLDVRLAFWKFMMFLVDIVFVISSTLMISGGISTILLFSSFNSGMGDRLQNLSLFWIILGGIFMFLALFGIFVAYKESTFLANLYGIATTVVFLSTIAAAIVGFTMISRSTDMVTEQLESMITGYTYSNYDFRPKIDWIQSKGPSDWQKLTWYWQPNHSEPSITDPMPASCCVQHSNYVNLTCENYHSSGCFEPIHQIVSKSMMVIGSSALPFAVVQAFGIVLGFVYARIIRRKKTQRNIQIWNSGQEYLAPYRSCTSDRYN